MSDEQRNLFFEEFRRAIGALPLSVVVSPKEKLQKLEGDPLVLLASTRYRNVRIDFIYSKKGSMLSVGNDPTFVLWSKDTNLLSDQEVINYSCEVAHLFYDISVQNIALVVYLQEIKTLTGTKKLVSLVHQFYKKGSDSYELLCTNFNHPDAGWKILENDTSSRFRDLKTNKLVKIDTNDEPSPSSTSLKLLRDYNFPLQTNLKVQQEVKSLDDIEPINQRIEFRIN